MVTRHERARRRAEKQSQGMPVLTDLLLNSLENGSCNLTGIGSGNGSRNGSGNDSSEFEQLSIARNIEQTRKERPRPSPDENAQVAVYNGLDQLDFSNLDLFCPVDVEEISCRWLNSYIAVPGQKVKEYPAAINSFIYRMLKSYSASATRGNSVLPFIHSLQLADRFGTSPLSTCSSLVRTCLNPMAGSELMLASMLEREMNCLYERRHRYSEEMLLAAFQAYLIYTMVLYFRLPKACQDIRHKMTNLQDLACLSAHGGLVCTAGRNRVRPRWEEWLIVETKRRTLFIMYLFDSVLLSQASAPTYLATELRGLPAPATKLLWQTTTRYSWEREYNAYIDEWNHEILTIDELWPIPKDFSEENIRNRRIRVDHWLEGIDEYGTMLYAIMSCTHGG